MFKIGPKARLGLKSSTPEASPDDPIYQRGFVIGEMHSTNSSPNVAQTDFIESVKKLGFPVNIQGTSALAQRNQETVDSSKKKSKPTPKLPPKKETPG
ncbi:MAG: hypothetical protein A4E71_02562 [Smithella sp. PtaU1.Bin162]|nr:MAG: hypothetical protein A4E71_02562 [Smithella sp. PtaU1.Bin162]